MPPWLRKLIEWLLRLIGRRPRRPVPAGLTCVDFTTWTPTTTGANPLNQSGVMFRVRDPGGNVLPASRIWQMGGFVGLDAGFSCELAFPDSSRIEATLVHFAQPASIEAWEQGGGSVGPKTMTVGQGVSETLDLTGNQLYRALITAPQDEVILLRFCFEP
jgi:hypothetical protein